jgi:flagellar basal-body rod modification protein FlgD
MYAEGLIPNVREPSSAQGASAPKDDLGRDTFLTLLVAQLKNQDPLNPMDSTQYTAQLAQFSSLEQLFSINDNLEGLKQSSDGESQENLLDYIGKEVTSGDNSLSLIHGETLGGTYDLRERGDVIVSIFDGLGQEVRTLYVTDQAPGKYSVPFDGRDNNGYELPDGDYNFAVRAFDYNGHTVDVKAGLSGKVTAVTYELGTPYLVVGDHHIRPESVSEVRLAEPF